jgi:hypothetical protein
MAEQERGEGSNVSATRSHMNNLLSSSSRIAVDLKGPCVDHGDLGHNIRGFLLVGDILNPS